MIEAVYSLAFNWQQFATKLRLSQDFIKLTEKNYRDSAQCLREAIVEWLKKNYNMKKWNYLPPSWRMLVQVVKDLDYSLAETIANKHRGEALLHHKGPQTLHKAAPSIPYCSDYNESET